MGMLLEIKAGPFAGRKISLRAGESLLIGRAPERAQFAVPHDSKMSGVHFAVECGVDGCRVIDKKSTNGTFLNGARIGEAMLLANGDEIKSGQTVFVVRMVPEAQKAASPSGARPARQEPGTIPNLVSASASKALNATPASAPARATSAPNAPPVRHANADPSARPVTPSHPGKPPVLTIGSWVFQKLPDRWKVQEGLGIQQDVKDSFPASIGVMEELLGRGITLQRYIDEQSKMLREYLREPKIEAVAAPRLFSSDETAALEVRHKIKDGPAIFHHRVYARSGSAIGVLTLTALEKDLASVRPIYDSALSAISFSHND